VICGVIASVAARLSSFEMPLTRPRMERKEERKIGKIDNGDGTDGGQKRSALA
jgi:hypothetical protein